MSVFALTADDAFEALSVIAGYDEGDAFSRQIPLGALSGVPARLRIGVPRGSDRDFFGSSGAEQGFEAAPHIAEGLGASLVEIDLRPFLNVARLLYEGP